MEANVRIQNVAGYTVKMFRANFDKTRVMFAGSNSFDLEEVIAPSGTIFTGANPGNSLAIYPESAQINGVTTNFVNDMAVVSRMGDTQATITLLLPQTAQVVLEGDWTVLVQN